MPLPAALVISGPDGVRLAISNRAFVHAAFAEGAVGSPLSKMLTDRIVPFLASAELMQSFDWSDGEAIDCRSFQVTLARSDLRIVDRCIISFIDHSSRRQTERSLRREMSTDSLTGLCNRQGFTDLIEQLGETRGEYAVLVVDLNRFGRLNACLGSLSGDELLITVARRIRGALRARDTLARIGGDEFGILVRIEQSAQEVRALAERIERVFTSPFKLTDYEIGIECSIGMSFGAQLEQEDAEELIRHAQFAAKRAKGSGEVETYQPQTLIIAREQFAMETALRRAIEDNRLELAYQPICDLTTHKPVAFEALARWIDGDGTVHSPSDFIPVAEESGLIIPLGRWVINEAANTLARWDHAHGGDCRVRMAVNLSAIQLQRDRIAEVIERALYDHALAGDRFTFELTESVIVGDPQRTAEIMHALKAFGSKLAMDDFGTGYSSLSYLQKLPIDILKIDRSFVTEMLADSDKVAIVRAILSLAQALGMKTTAEGVETLELSRTLGALGCAFGQGYFFARPLSAMDAYSMIAPPLPPSA